MGHTLAIFEPSSETGAEEEEGDEEEFDGDAAMTCERRGLAPQAREKEGRGDGDECGEEECGWWSWRKDQGLGGGKGWR